MEKTVKPGLKTTEFWVAVAGNVLALLVLFGLVDPSAEEGIQSASNGLIAAVFSAVSNGSYIISRGIAKK